ncbi:MAG: hypothetical protein WBB82_16375 [Limnothrix sp.]
MNSPSLPSLQSIPAAQQAGFLQTSPQQPVIAQVTGYVEDPDVLGGIQTGFSNFVESGQLWAMLGGFVLGYMFAGLRRG